tara:strand:+ start:176 stop:334 length:159 start_codon:yes stop_codon:yes gene_type:complete
MTIRQAFNRKTKAWVKFKFEKGNGFRIIDVKQRNPMVKFKGIKVRGQRPRRK